MRNTFINTLCALADTQTDIFLLCGDLGYSVLEPFAERYPDRFCNVGIAEQNMTQVAVGLAREGYNVFTYSIGNFPTLRCMEHIRYDICYHSANVKVVAVGAGYAYGPQGVSHHTTEDIAMMRVLPGMLICSPADPYEAGRAADFMSTYNGPAYIRLNKSGELLVHKPEEHSLFRPGYFSPLRSGSHTLVLTTGAIASHVLEELRNANRDWALWTAPFIGNYDRPLLLSMAQQFERIITIEEHQLNGGFGASLLEAYGDLFAEGHLTRMPKLKRIAIPNCFIRVAGTQEYLRRTVGLTITGINGSFSL